MKNRRDRAVFTTVVVLALAMAAAQLLLIVFRSPPDARGRAAALRTLRLPIGPVHGRDGSDALWLVGHAVPAAERADVAAATRRWVERKRKPGTGAGKDPRARYPRNEAPAKGARGLCPGDADCLAAVRAHPADAAALVQRHAPLLEATRALAGYDGLRYGVRYWNADYPDYRLGRRLRLTALALRFVQGDAPGAIAETCTDIAAWRRLGADNDLIVGTILASRHVEQDLELLARMLAEVGHDTPLPGSCAEALAPTRPAELTLCRAMRTEFRGFEASAAKLSGPSKAWNPWVRFLDETYDHDQYLGLAARGYALPCLVKVEQAALADKSVRGIPHKATCGWLEARAYPLGCALGELIWNDAIYGYVDTRTDQAAMLALMRTLVWLRGQSADPSTWAARLPQRPASLGLRREPVLDLAAGTLSIPMFDTPLRRKKDAGDPTFALAVRPPSPK